MNRRIVPAHLWKGLCVLGLIATATPASAEVQEGATATIKCFHSPHDVPGLNENLPNWTSADEKVRSLRVSDPRWGGDPLRNANFALESIGPMHYRAVVEGDEMAVSLQIAKDDDGPNGATDSVYFGLASHDGTIANVIQLTPNTAEGSALPDFAVIQPWTLGPTGWVKGAQITSGPVPSSIEWIKDAAYWNDPTKTDMDGAVWAVQFRIPLSLLTLQGQPAKFIAGAFVEDSTGPAAPKISTFDENYCDPTNCKNECADQACQDLCDEKCAVEDGVFFADPFEWTELKPLTGACTEGSVTIKKSDLTTAYGHKVVDEPGQVNQFFVQPEYIPSAEHPEWYYSDESIRAIFKMSNWGTTWEWETLKTDDGAASVLNGWNNEPISLSCTNAAGDDNVCTLITNTEVDGQHHQCLAVQLHATGANDITFDTAAVYINTRWETPQPAQSGSAEVDEEAEINVKGIAEEKGLAAPPDVYLQVMTRNMPAAGDELLTMDVGAINALRAQVDLSFNDPGTCSVPNDTCVGFSTKETLARLCGHECQVSRGESFCGEQDTKAETADGCYCFTKLAVPLMATATAPTAELPYETCEVSAPKGGGLDYDNSSLSGEQKLAAEVPTITVYPYYDSGEIVLVDGKEYPRLVAMPTFGMYVTHDQPYYGFLHGLTDGNGGALHKDDRGLYRVDMPVDGIARVRVKVSAQGEPHYAPFSEVAGFGMALSHGWGRVHLSGVSKGGAATDLSAATFNLKAVLEQDGTELVSGIGGGIELARTSGTSSSATFKSAGNSPSASATVLDLPLVGQVTSISVDGASIARPSNCGWFGTTTLATEFAIDDGVNPGVSVRGEDQWTCGLFTLWNI